jgi:hypothetical protein
MPMQIVTRLSALRFGFNLRKGDLGTIILHP